MTPYWEDANRGLRVFLGDCRDILPQFADGEFGSVIGDPPYWSNRESYPGEPPDSPLLGEMLRVSAGPVVLFGGARPQWLRPFVDLEPTPDRMLIWAPMFSRTPFAQSGMRFRFHTLWAWHLPKNQDVLRSDVIRVPTAGMTHKGGGPFDQRIHHPGRKPEELMDLLLRAFGGRSTLDPYMGSGTTLVAAAKLGIPATGVEISERYCEMARCRLEGGFMDDEPAHLFNQTECTRE